MCGIAGVWAAGEVGITVSELGRRVTAMTETLIHRGPDASGTWIDEDARIGLGHRRLSIIDVSETGHQPMFSACGRMVIVYNGELYNTAELRRELEALGVSFKGGSDTEVLVNALARWGLDITLSRLNGIFSFAVWDKQQRTISLARDHVGVKPLFWSLKNGLVQFASEIRAFEILPDFDRSINMEAVGTYLQYNYIRSPFTIYKNICSLDPGTVLTIDATGNARKRTYWNLAEIAVSNAEERAQPINRQAAVDQLEELLTDAVSRQLVADVPIGAFLSGGIDSSTVAALIQKCSGRPAKTFSIGFEMPELNEAEAAKAVAQHLGTEHTELYVSERDALDLIPQLASHFDQPLADTSQTPTFLLCKMARRHVTVALSGDGGDELFYGYSRYWKASAARQRLAYIPKPVRRMSRFCVEALGGGRLRRGGLSRSNLGMRAAWHASRLLDLASDDLNDVYLGFLLQWPEPEQVAPSAVSDREAWLQSKAASNGFGELMMLHDARTYMTDCVLAKVDRASMANSLEVRVPLLDPRVIEMAWRLPISVKFADGQSKWALRQVLYKHVPPELVNRPKAGFGAPIGHWLRGPLREWAEELISEQALKAHGLFAPKTVRRAWHAHLHNGVDASSYLWSVIMMQSWLQLKAGRQDRFLEFGG